MTATVTYSREWTQRYFVKQYVHTDPVVTHGSNAVVPFDWETLANKDPAARAFFDDAANYGVGRNGLSILVRNRGGIYALVSFSGEQSRAEWAQYKSVVKDLEIGQPINSEQRSETADGVARESEGRTRLRKRATCAWPRARPPG